MIVETMRDVMGTPLIDQFCGGELIGYHHIPSIDRNSTFVIKPLLFTHDEKKKDKGDAFATHIGIAGLYIHCTRT